MGVVGKRGAEEGAGGGGGVTMRDQSAFEGVGGLGQGNSINGLPLFLVSCYAWYCAVRHVLFYFLFRGVKAVDLITTSYKLATVTAGVPGGSVGGPRAYLDQSRGFESHRLHART